MSPPDPSDSDGGRPLHLRHARADDRDAIVEFTTDTWADRGTGDYIPRIYEEWIADDGEGQRTFVLDARDPSQHPETADPGDVAGVVQVVLLSPTEAWLQGMRIHPEFRRRGLGTRLTHAGFQWARDRGAVVARNMVHSWNTASVGLSRTAGFESGTEVRWARPRPDAAADPDLPVVADADAGWSFWTASDARTALRGLALDDEESWAASELDRARLRTAAADDRLFVVVDGGTRALGLRTRTYTFEGEDDGPTTYAEYAVGAWADADAARALFAAVARDAAAEGADETRVLVPEGVRWVGDAALAGVPMSEEPTFVLAADLTARATWSDLD